MEQKQPVYVYYAKTKQECSRVVADRLPCRQGQLVYYVVSRMYKNMAILFYYILMLNIFVLYTKGLGSYKCEGINKVH